jgi:hypothetical protein
MLMWKGLLMPYIKGAIRREDLDPHWMAGTVHAETEGELNFQITRLMIVYLQDHGLSYATLNDISGAVNNAYMEFYRRVVVPFEEEKIKANGDVFPPEFVGK